MARTADGETEGETASCVSSQDRVVSWWMAKETGVCRSRLVVALFDVQALRPAAASLVYAVMLESFCDKVLKAANVAPYGFKTQTSRGHFSILSPT